jgi:hypothetical protein
MPIKRCHPRKEDPYKERGRMMLARHWMNKLRSNVRPLEPSNFDIVSLSNNLWMRWATLIVIYLVLFHNPQLKGSKPPLKKCYNYIERGHLTSQWLNLHWHPTKLYHIPSQVGPWSKMSEPSNPWRCSEVDVVFECKFATLEEMCSWSQGVLTWTLK